MPDHDDADLSPEELQVRRLLADARHDEPMPAEVAARLDRVIADLADTRTPGAQPLPDRAAHRRRHRRNLVLAAAAVVVLGFGASRLDLSSSDDADGGSSADSSAVQGESEAGGTAGDAPLASAPGAPPLELDSGAFEREVQRYAEQRRLAEDPDQGGRSAAESAPSTYDLTRPACSVGDVGRGRQVDARYDGEPAVLVVRPASGGRQVVDLYLCGTDEPLRSTQVPAG